VVAGIFYPVSIAVLGIGNGFALVMVSLSGALLIYRHKDNIKRIINGTESKLTFRK
jgi:glycerol-3-phosphate acyltransferase PlsY